MRIKRSMVKSHEKMVTASYPQLIKRGTVINIAGTLTCYLMGLGLWYLHKKLFNKPDDPTFEDTKLEKN